VTVPDAVLEAVRASIPPTVGLHDGEVGSDVLSQGKIVADSIPYVVCYFTPGDSTTHRVSGRTKRRTTEFQLTSVGLSRKQAAAVADRVRAGIEGTRVLGGLVRQTDSDYVRPDPDARTTDNRTVFYAVNRFSVSN